MRTDRELLLEVVRRRLGARVNGARVLDLFARDGFLGLAALELDAHEVTFVDRDAESMLELERRIRGMGREESCRVLCADALDVPELASPDERFGVVFVHAPRLLMLTSPRRVLERCLEIGRRRAGIVPPALCLILPATYDGPIPFRDHRLEECGSKTVLIVDARVSTTGDEASDVSEEWNRAPDPA